MLYYEREMIGRYIPALLNHIKAQPGTRYVCEPNHALLRYDLQETIAQIQKNGCVIIGIELPDIIHLKKSNIGIWYTYKQTLYRTEVPVQMWFNWLRFIFGSQTAEEIVDTLTYKTKKQQLGIALMRQACWDYATYAQEDNSVFLHHILSPDYTAAAKNFNAFGLTPIGIDIAPPGVCDTVALWMYNHKNELTWLLLPKHIWHDWLMQLIGDSICCCTRYIGGE